MIHVRPLSSRIGAEVHGVELDGTLRPEIVAELRKALVEFKVLFFRDQTRMTPDKHLDFGRLFGTLEAHPVATADRSELMTLRRAPDVATARANFPYGEDYWHSDVSWREHPSFGSILRAVEIPPVGGDTLWADMEAAFAGLSPQMQGALRPLRAIHDFDRAFGPGLAPEDRAAMAKRFPPVEHPVVRTNPDTGAPLLYVNEIFATRIAGMDLRESDSLLQFLYRQATKPEYQCRFSWREGSVAFWDNRTTQHYACHDTGKGVREMHRVTISGDRPY